MPFVPAITRRQLLARSFTITAGAAFACLPFPLLAEELATLDVAYAGSMSSLMEGPIKSSVARTLKIEFHGRGQGSSALAHLIAGGSLHPDVFIPVTPGPALTLLRAGKADSAQPIAHTEMVIAYSPKGRFSSRFDAAAKGKADLWKILLEPGLRFARTDPVIDPQGRNIIFTMMLAAKANKQTDLVEKILGPTINEKQIFSEPTMMSRLQSGEMDAASAYKIQPGPLNLPYVKLPADINLSSQDVHAKHPDVTLSVGGKSYTPEPLIYYVAVLKEAANAKGATAFVEWLKGDEGQAIFRKYNYDPPGDASALHA